MFKVFYFCVLFIVPFVKCNYGGLNIQLGTCPAIKSDPNLDLKAIASIIWTVTARSNNLNVGIKDCQNIAFLLDGNILQVFTMFSNSETEVARAYQARAIAKTPGIYQFTRSFLGDNYVFKGSFSIPATDNKSFAVVVQCSQLLGIRITTIYVLIKGNTAPPRLTELINDSLARNGLSLTPPLEYTNLEKKCSVVLTNPFPAIY